MLEIYARTFMIATRVHPLEPAVTPLRPAASRQWLVRALTWLSS